MKEREGEGCKLKKEKEHDKKYRLKRYLWRLMKEREREMKI